MRISDDAAPTAGVVSGTLTITNNTKGVPGSKLTVALSGTGANSVVH
jgi:hypothetical protein